MDRWRMDEYCMVSKMPMVKVSCRQVKYRTRLGQTDGVKVAFGRKG